MCWLKIAFSERMCISDPGCRAYISLGYVGYPGYISGLKVDLIDYFPQDALENVVPREIIRDFEVFGDFS